MSVLVVLEQSDGNFHRMGWEAVVAAKELGLPVFVATIGAGTGIGFCSLVPDSIGQSGIRGVSAHVSGSRLCAEAGDAVWPGTG